MYYEEAGEGEPLVLLLDATGGLDFHEAGWGALVPRFAQQYRTLHVEHRGHGRTNNPAGLYSYGQNTRADVVGPVILEFLRRHGPNGQAA